MWFFVWFVCTSPALDLDDLPADAVGITFAIAWRRLPNLWCCRGLRSGLAALCADIRARARARAVTTAAEATELAAKLRADEKERAILLHNKAFEVDPESESPACRCARFNAVAPVGGGAAAFRRPSRRPVPPTRPADPSRAGVADKPDPRGDAGAALDPGPRRRRHCGGARDIRLQDHRRPRPPHHENLLASPPPRRW